MMETLKAAVIGAGAMGANHVRLYSQLLEVELVGVADISKTLANEVGARYRCNSYKKYLDLLDNEKPDIITIAVPTQAHTKVAIDCLEAGVATLVEKPIADTVENAKKIMETSNLSGIPLMIGHIERFNPAVSELKKRLKKKCLGRIFSMNATRVGPFPHRIRDVGVVIDLAVHDIDIMRYVSNAEVKRVFAETEKNIHTKCEDILSGILKFDSGAVGNLDINWLTPEKIRELKVIGEKGMFVVKYITQELMFYENLKANGDRYNYQDILMGVAEGDITQIRIKKREPLRLELEAFIESVKKGKTPPVSGKDGLKALEIALAISDSAQKNKVMII